MGTASSKKFLKNGNGAHVEEAALTTSAGAGDADKIPALNASGVLDPTIINAKDSSVGAGDAGKIPQLDSSGRISATFMPSGIGADTASVVASESLADGDFVNIYNNGGTANVRKSDGSTTGKAAHGFVLAAVASGATALVYCEGANTHCTGLTPGDQFLSGTTAGLSTATAPTGAGKTVQHIGFAYSATEMNFERSTPITLA